MSQIRGKNTKIEIKMKKILKETGYKFEMHPEMYDLKGNVIPDEIIAFRFENLNFDSEIDEEL